MQPRCSTSQTWVKWLPETHKPKKQSGKKTRYFTTLLAGPAEKTKKTLEKAINNCRLFGESPNICMHTYVYIYAHINLYIYTYACICTCVYICSAPLNASFFLQSKTTHGFVNLRAFKIDSSIWKIHISHITYAYIYIWVSRWSHSLMSWGRTQKPTSLPAIWLHSITQKITFSNWII